MHCLQVKYAFFSHVQQQVYATEVRDESEFLSEYLVVWFECLAVCGMSGCRTFPEIRICTVVIGLNICFRYANVRGYFGDVAHQFEQCHVEVDKECELSAVKPG